jgi:hypothetical protein
MGRSIYTCAYIEKKYFKIFSRITRPISFKLATNHLFKFVQIMGQLFFKGEIFTVMQK